MQCQKLGFWRGRGNPRKRSPGVKWRVAGLEGLSLGGWVSIGGGANGLCCGPSRMPPGNSSSGAARPIFAGRFVVFPIFGWRRGAVLCVAAILFQAYKTLSEKLQRNVGAWIVEGCYSMPTAKQDAPLRCCGWGERENTGKGFDPVVSF